jgi:hypothetical protein
MTTEYTEQGGLRWGQSYWVSSNVTWPFVTLRLTGEGIYIRWGLWTLASHVLEFARRDITALRKRRGLFSQGIVIEHSRSDCPPFVLFWTLNYAALSRALADLGYGIAPDNPSSK